MAVLSRSDAIAKAPASVRKLLGVAFGGKRTPTGNALVVASLTDAATARAFLRGLSQMASDDAIAAAVAINEMDAAERNQVWRSLVAVGAASGPTPAGRPVGVVREIATTLLGATTLGETVAAAIALL